MNFQQFIDKYNGKAVDFDGAFQAQCVDLYRQYVKEVCNVPQSPALGSGGANKIWETYLPQYFERITNTPTGVPQFGDIIIWNTKIGPFGHVAIFISGNATAFTSFDQNWPDTGGKGVAHKQDHDYKGVQGWLRLKTTAPPPPPPPPSDPCASVRTELDKTKEEVTTLKGEIVELKKQIGNSGTMTKRITELEKAIKDQDEIHTEAISLLERNLKKQTELREEFEGKLTACEDKLPTIITKPVESLTVGQLIGELLRRIKFKKKGN